MARRTSGIGSILLPFFVLSASLNLQQVSSAQTPPHAPAVRKSDARLSPEFQKIKELVQQGHLDEARSQVLEQLQRTPASVEGLNLLGIIEMNRHDYAAAESAFRNAIRLAPSSVKTHVNLGNFYMAQKQADPADKEFRTALRIEPANQDANYNLGILLMARGLPAEAITHFIRVRPANIATTINLIQAYFQTNRTAEALHLATDLSNQNKADVQVHFSLGSMLASAKQYQQAQAELEQADALQPGTFEILYNLGQTFLRNNEFPKAELALGRALKLKPETPDVLYLLAQVYEKESRPLDALDLLVRAHKIVPENIDVIYLMAQVSISQNYYEDAIPLLESGLELAPRRTDLLATLGESYFMSGKVNKAIEAFTKLVDIEPSARSYAFLGLPYLYLGRFDEAKKFFQQGLKLDPHNNSCLFNSGLIAERQGDNTVAEAKFVEILKSSPEFPDALLELANLRIAQKNFAEAADLLRKYVKVSHNPSTGYYKLAMVERSLHQTAAADRDLSVFQTLSKDVSTGPYPFEHLFDYLDTRSKLDQGARNQLDLAELNNEIKKHPDQPENLYMLAEAYLKSGKFDDARSTIADLDKLSASDFRTLTGVGVLLARYHLYDEAIQHFQLSLVANPDSDEVKFDLANAYFRRRQFTEALAAADRVSEAGRKDDAYLSLLGDIYAHLGDTAGAEVIFLDVINRNPDNDQDYLTMALLQFRQNNVAAAKQTLLKGQARIPGSGKILWGLGLTSILEGNTAKAADELERAVDLLPEWPGSYSTLGVFYFQTGQIAKAQEVLNRFKNSSAVGGLDITRIEQVLAQAPATSSTLNEPMTAAKQTQLLQLALSLADRTL